MNVTPELLELSNETLRVYGHADAMPDDPGTIDKLTVALRSLIKAVEADMAPAPRQLPKWQTDPENFEQIEIRDVDGNVIGGGSLFKGAKPSTSAGRYEFDRRRAVLVDQARVRAVGYLSGECGYRQALHESAISDTVAGLAQYWLDTGRAPAPCELIIGRGHHVIVDLRIPAEHVKEA